MGGEHNGAQKSGCPGDALQTRAAETLPSPPVHRSLLCSPTTSSASRWLLLCGSPWKGWQQAEGIAPVAPWPRSSSDFSPQFLLC